LGRFTTGSNPRSIATPSPASTMPMTIVAHGVNSSTDADRW